MTVAQRDSDATHAELVKSLSLQLGFDVCGIAAAGDNPDPAGIFARWLGAGFHADMRWMARTAGVRSDVSAKLPGVRSVVVVARNYYVEGPAAAGRGGRIARYAWGRDYHKVLRKPLIRLAKFLDTLEPGARSYASVDTGPVLERGWAALAGVASIGKHGIGLRRDMGSWFFLGTVLTTVELAPDTPAEDVCGTCTLCIDACPTDAIVSPRMVDSGRCISYQTIENRGDVPEDLRPLHGDWLFGCDVCQDVCPWNRFARETTEEAFRARAGQANPDSAEIAGLSAAEFDVRFAGTAIRRAKYAGMQRNARIVLENQRSKTQPRE